MRKILLLLATAVIGKASIFPILSDSVSSDFGVTGTGSYGSGVSVQYTLEQYDRSDVGQSGLSQSIYFRYTYEFSATPGLSLAAKAATLSKTSELNHLILALAPDCGSDRECIFGISSQGAEASLGPITLYGDDAGLDNPIYGIKFDNFSLAVRPLTLSFFSNRIPDGNGRIYMRRGEDYLISDAGAVITPNTHVLPQDAENQPAVPEPMSFVLLGSGLAAGACLRRLRER